MPDNPLRATKAATHEIGSRGPPECVKLFETSFAKECYAAMGSGGLMKTVGARAGGSGVPFTKRDGLRAYAA